jgi:hypothetical protein
MAKDGTSQTGLWLASKNLNPKPSRKKFRANLRIVVGQQRHTYDRWLNWKPKGPPPEQAA